MMVVSDGEGLPIGLLVASARPHELTLARAASEAVGVSRRRGRPRKRPRELVADKTYDSCEFRGWLWRKEIKPTIPRIEKKGPKRGCPGRMGPGYRERCSGCLLG